jgi:hypothetical protein
MTSHCVSQHQLTTQGLLFAGSMKSRRQDLQCRTCARSTLHLKEKQASQHNAEHHQPKTTMHPCPGSSIYVFRSLKIQPTPLLHQFEPQIWVLEGVSLQNPKLSNLLPESMSKPMYILESMSKHGSAAKLAYNFASF